MRKFLHYIVVILAFSTTTLLGSIGVVRAMSVPTTVADTSRVVEETNARVSSTLESAKERRAQRSFFSSFRNFFPFKSADEVANEKVLSNVKVFPNPVVDQINLSYRLSKESTVVIKVMDALGNEVMTLLNQELDSGAQSHVFDTDNKLDNGFYFIRVSAGTETVVKRISVL